MKRLHAAHALAFAWLIGCGGGGGATDARVHDAGHDAGAAGADGATADRVGAAGGDAADTSVADAAPDLSVDAPQTQDADHPVDGAAEAPADGGANDGGATDAPRETSETHVDAAADGVALSCWAMGDFDGDGLTDCVRTQASADASDVLDVVFNKGVGGSRYVDTIVLTPGIVSSTDQVIINADLDHDGRQDLVVQRPRPDFEGPPVSSLKILRGQTNGHFVLPLAYDDLEPGRYFKTEATADIDGDGTADLVTSFFQLQPGALYGAFYWTVFPSSAIAIWGGITAFPSIRSGTPLTLAADLNHDRYADLVSIGRNNPSLDTGPNHLCAFLGAGLMRACVDSLTTNNAWPVWFTLANLDADPNVDLVVVMNQNAAAPSDKVVTLRGNGDGSFAAPVDIAGATALDVYVSGLDGPGDLTVTDVNRDGKPDVLVLLGDSSAQLAVFLGVGDGTFQAKIVAPGTFRSDPLASTTGFTVTDVNADGNPDVVGGLGGPSTLYGDGTGHFSTTPP